MYHCRQCQRPMTEFDVYFSKKISSSLTLQGKQHGEFRGDGKCYKCFCGNTATQKTMNKVYALIRRKELSKKQVLILCAAAIVGLMMVFAYYVLAGGSNGAVYGIGSVPFYLLLLVEIVIGAYFFVVTIQLIGAFMDVSYYDSPKSWYLGSHYESTISSDGNTITTKKVDDWVTSNKGSDVESRVGCSAPLIFLFSPFWCVFYFLYTLTFSYKLKKLCPAYIQDAFIEAKKNVACKKINLSVISNKREKYRERLHEIQTHKNVWGDQGVIDMSKKVPIPVDYVFIHTDKYVVVDCDGRNMALLITKSNNGKVIGRLLTGEGYFIYEENPTLEGAINWWEDQFKSSSHIHMLRHTLKQYCALLRS